MTSGANSAAARLDGKIAVITGSTQGLGEATARLFAARGAAGLVLCGRNAENGARVAAEITGHGCAAFFVAADLAEVAACRAVLAEADARFGRVDCLVNCAALTDRGGILDTTPELFDRLFAVNVRAPFFLIQEAAKLMRRDGIAGAIVNIISMSSHGGEPFITAYSASKGALATLTRTAAYALIKLALRQNPKADLRVVVNHATSTAEGQRTHAVLAAACRNFLKTAPLLAGVIRRDFRVPDAIRHQVPLLTRHPMCEAAQDVERLTGTLLEAP